MKKDKNKLGRMPARLQPAPAKLANGGSWRDDRTSSSARGYGYQWQKERAAFLLEHPLCVMCRAAGQVAAASVVDHVRPHRGDMVLFWDRSNWQALCSTCHSKHKQRMEAGM